MKNLSTKAIMIMLSVMSVAIVALTVAVIGLASGRSEEPKETPAATQKAAEGSEPVSLPEPEGSTEENTTEPESGLKEQALMEVPTLPETSEKENTEETAPAVPETKEDSPRETEKEHQKETKEKETKEKETKEKETQPKETKEKKTEPAETEPKETKEKETRPAETVTEPEDTEWEDPWTDPEDTEREDPWTDPEDIDPEDPWTDPEDTEREDPWTDPEDTDPEDPWTDPEDTDPEDPWTDPEDTEWEDPDTEHIHDFSDWVTVKEPTCTNPGTEKAVCECGAEMTHEMQPLGHSMGDWDEIDPPTVDSEGLMMRSCSRCGREETKSILRLEPEEPEEQYRKVSVSIATVENGGIYYKINGKYYEITISDRTDTTGSWTTIISYYANGQFLMEQFIPHGAYSTTCALSPIYTKK